MSEGFLGLGLVVIAGAFATGLCYLLYLWLLRPWLKNLGAVLLVLTLLMAVYYGAVAVTILNFL